VSIAVTGATGFLGRHVVAELDRLRIPATLNSRTIADPKHRSVALDLLAAPVDAFDRLGKPDTLIHLAWGGLPNYRSAHHTDVELPAQVAFLERMVQSGLRNLVVTGTCLEYGMQSGALREDLPTQPHTPYGVAKDALRRHLLDLRERTAGGFRLTWTRLFYMFGEGQAPHSLHPQLRAAVARGDAVFPMSGGMQLRDYLPVEDVARAIVSLALQNRHHGVVNVCSGRPVSVRALVEGWIRDHGWSITPEYGHYPYPDWEPMEFWGDRTKLDRCLAAN